MPFLRRYPALASLFLGALAACGFAPLDLWWLTIACLAAWVWLVHDAASLKQALSRGWAFGVGHFTINDNWFQHSFEFQDKMPPVIGYAAPVALALYLAVYPAIAAWIVSEWLRATMFTGYAWDPLGVIWVPVQPVAALAAWIGTYALSGLTVALAGGLLLVPRRRGRIAGVAAAAALLLVAQGLSYQLYHTPAPIPPDTPRLRIVQPNVPQDQRGESDGPAMMAKLAALSGRPGAAPRLILWPEGVVRDYIEDGYPWYAYETSPRLLRWQMARLLGPRDRLLTGGTALQFDAAGNAITATNSVFAIDPQARIRGRYDKAHLVPYGEYLPMPWLLRPLGFDRLVPGAMDFVEGPGPQAISLPGFGALGVQICYEIIFSGQVIDRAHRPRLLFNPSNDAWFGAWGPPQHLAQARMRAIEEGLPVVRATPNGISAVIAADGRLIATIPHKTAGAIEVPIPAALPPTLFARIGNWAAVVVALLLIVGAVALRRRRG